VIPDPLFRPLRPVFQPLEGDPRGTTPLGIKRNFPVAVQFHELDAIREITAACRLDFLPSRLPQDNEKTLPRRELQWQPRPPVRFTVFRQFAYLSGHRVPQLGLTS